MLLNALIYDYILLCFTIHLSQHPVENFQNNIKVYKLDILNPTSDMIEKSMSFIYASLDNPIVLL